MDRAKPEGWAAEFEDDGRVSFKMAHVGVTCRSTTHDIDGECSVIASLWVRGDANEHAVIDVIIVGALQLSRTVLKGKGHLCVHHDEVEGGSGGRKELVNGREGEGMLALRQHHILYGVPAGLHT